MPQLEHQLVADAAVVRCAVCLSACNYTPRHACPGQPQYDFADTPANLKSKTELHKLGFKPGGPGRAVRYSANMGGLIALYDLNEAQARPKPTAAQTAALAKAQAAREQKWRDRAQQYYDDLQAEDDDEEAAHKADEAAAVKWSQGAIKNGKWLALNTQTTGLEFERRIVEIALVDADGSVLFSSLVNPGVPIPAAATAIHKISDTDVAEAPTFEQIYPRLADSLAGRKVIAYNAGFHRHSVENELRRAGLPLIEGVKWMDYQSLYAQWVNDWNDYHGDYINQPLPVAVHRAVECCRALIALIQQVAAAGDR